MYFHQNINYRYIFKLILNNKTNINSETQVHPELLYRGYTV